MSKVRVLQLQDVGINLPNRTPTTRLKDLTDVDIDEIVKTVSNATDKTHATDFLKANRGLENELFANVDEVQLTDFNVRMKNIIASLNGNLMRLSFSKLPEAIKDITGNLYLRAYRKAPIDEAPANADPAGLDTFEGLDTDLSNKMLNDPFAQRAIVKNGNVAALANFLSYADATSKKSFRDAFQKMSYADKAKFIEEVNKYPRLRDRAADKELTSLFDENVTEVTWRGRLGNWLSDTKCGKNPLICAGTLGLAGGFTTYWAVRHKQLSEAERACFDRCYPGEYEENKKSPTDSAKPYTKDDMPEWNQVNADTEKSPAQMYSEYTPAEKQALCTHANLQLTGKTDCKDYCTDVCHRDKNLVSMFFKDIVKPIVRGASEGLKQASSPLWETLTSALPNFWKYIAACVVVLMLVIMVRK